MAEHFIAKSAVGQMVIVRFIAFSHTLYSKQHRF